ncbi:MAG TPA: hypothetical protein P5125_01390 [Kiritimatiellia bacterium]|nr:hypothetical protein [Kiritimatiellia bacterium]HRU18986.1 hypothetical protein [Kiritimatiellia bacterium]
MIEDVYEPLALYRDRFKAEHADNTAAFFERLVERSGVDENANAATVAEIRTLDAQLAAADSSRSNWKTLRMLLVIIVVAGVIGLILFILPIFSPDIEPPIRVGGLWAAACAAVAAGGIALIAAKLNPALRLLDERLRLLTEYREAKMTEALAQLAPLNRLYDWGMIAKLIQQTVPRLALDPYFSRARLDELHRSFGWDDSFNRDRSVLFAQSGEINGNPFVLAETLDFHMGAKTYHGSITISWQERESYTDSEGRTRTRWVTRTETLHASVDKPAPEYSREKFLIYGNEAAPDLTFSRNPSNLSNAGDGFFSRWRMRRAVAKLEAFSRNLDDEYGYTIVSNRQFAALFHAIDRNDEVQFRLLFTPLAQQQMLNLLRDRTVGFGDNFTFVKDRMINLVRPAHLATTDITAAPSLFHHYDLAAAREFFNTYSNAYFRALYFALAPVLTIPLYQQHRSHADIYASVLGKTASFWEHEAIANFHGQHAFGHHEAITENLLKTQAVRTDDGYTDVVVTAHGFRGEHRVDYVSKFGGDGRWHKVPVKWIEYIPVQRTSTLTIRETDGLTLQDYEEQSQTSPDWQTFFRKYQIEPKHVSFRRSIVSFVSPS